MKLTDKLVEIVLNPNKEIEQRFYGRIIQDDNDLITISHWERQGIPCKTTTISKREEYKINEYFIKK